MPESVHTGKLDARPIPWAQPGYAYQITTDVLISIKLDVFARQ
jgi:hypothetical protein